MTSILLALDFALVVLIVAIGFVGGWCAHWYEARRRMKTSEDERKLVRDVLANLHQLIDNVSSERVIGNDYLTFDFHLFAKDNVSLDIKGNTL